MADLQTSTDVELENGVRLLQTPADWLSLYRWRPGVWYVCTGGQVVCTLSGADVGIAQSDGLIRRSPRRRSMWELAWTDDPGVPLRVYRLAEGRWVAVIPGEAGRVRAETVAPTEEMAVSATIGKANDLRRTCRKAVTTIEEVGYDG